MFPSKLKCTLTFEALSSTVADNILIIPMLASGILLSPPSVRPSVRYAISSQTAGQNPTKFGEWLAYTSGPGEGSKGQILTSMGICDGVPSTARSSFCMPPPQNGGGHIVLPPIVCPCVCASVDLSVTLNSTVHVY